MELYRECQCTLFALVTATTSTTTASDSRSANGGAGTAESTGKRQGSGKGSGLSRENRRRVRVHPAYATLVRKDDVGVFIGDNHKVQSEEEGGEREKKREEWGAQVFVGSSALLEVVHIVVHSIIYWYLCHRCVRDDFRELSWSAASAR